MHINFEHSIPEIAGIKGNKVIVTMCFTQPTFNHIIDYTDAMMLCLCVKYTHEN
jgi:hypothetical protein